MILPESELGRIASLEFSRAYVTCQYALSRAHCANSQCLSLEFWLVHAIVSIGTSRSIKCHCILQFAGLREGPGCLRNFTQVISLSVHHNSQYIVLNECRKKD